MNEEDLEDNSPYVSLNLELVKEKIPTFSSDKLCEMIVCDRYFGCYQDIAIMSMEELAKRRQLGDPFPFEEKIEAGYKELPPLNFTTLNIREILQQAIRKNK
jgi:hypothetical protein